MKLYSYWRSSTSYRTRIALALKGIEVEIVPVHLANKEHRQDEYKVINPSMAVPALELEDGEIITQSMAIIEYLETLVPEPELMPKEPILKAQIMAVSQVVAMDIHPINNPRVAGELKNRFNANDQDCQKWIEHFTLEGFKAIETFLPENGEFAFGEHPSLADVCLMPQIYNARRWKVPIENFPKILKVEKTCEQDERFRQAHPDNQIDAEVTK